MFAPLDDGYLVLEHPPSFLVVGRALRRIPLCIETVDGEVGQGLCPDDLVVASAPKVQLALLALMEVPVQ